MNFRSPMIPSFYLHLIMWHASTGDQTFTGSFGLMLAHGILRMIGEMNELYEIDEEYELGLRAFDTQTREQKAWSLHKTAFGLLDEATPIPDLTAYMEATIAVIFDRFGDARTERSCSTC